MSKRVRIGATAEIAPGQMKSFQVEGQSILVAKLAQGYCAVANRCSHLPLPLTGGKLEGETITCPWHGSSFNLCSGENLDWVRGVASLTLPNWSRRVIALGKKPQGLQTYTVIEEDGQLYVEL